MKKSLAGRAVVIALFVSVSVYFGTAIFASILNQLYGKPPAQEAGAERTGCPRALKGLRDAIDRQVALESQHARRAGGAAARWRLWERGWLEKLAGARARCAGDEAP